MNVILIPGLTGHIMTLLPLRHKLEAEGHTCHWPGFSITTLIQDELQVLLRTLDEIGPAAIIGHSAGGLLAVLAASSRHPNVKMVVGLGTPLMGQVDLPIPHYEARSLVGWLAPLTGPDDVRRFLLPHCALPLAPCVQNWVADKLGEPQ